MKAALIEQGARYYGKNGQRREIPLVVPSGLGCGFQTTDPVKPPKRQNARGAEPTSQGRRQMPRPGTINQNTAKSLGQTEANTKQAIKEK
jgi:hypothetical protein